MNKAFIQRLFVKRESGASVTDVSQLDLIEGYGIKEDINAQGMSPRQVLVVSSEDLTKPSIPPGELSENIVLADVSPEAFKPGAMISFTSGAAIRLTFYCEPCKRIAHLVDSLESIQNKRGILGVVVQSGAIEIGEIAKIEPNYYPALSDVPYERFLDFLSKIPRGRVVTYKQVIQGIGVDKSYFRVIPTYLKKTPINYPIHRVLDSQGRTVYHITQQKELLEGEGINVASQLDSDGNNQFSVSLEKYAWEDLSIFQCKYSTSENC